MATESTTCPMDAPRTLASRTEAGAPTRLSLRWNFSWMFVANVVYAGCQWGMLSMLAKLGTTAMVGQFVLALAVTTPVMALCLLQLRTVQATDAAREYRFGHYLALRLATTTLALVAIGGISIASGYRWDVVLVIAAAAISAAVDSVSDIVYGLLQQHERMDRIAQSRMIKGILAVTCLTATIAVTGHLVWGILAVAAVRVVVLFAWDFLHAASVFRHALPDTASSPVEPESLRPRWYVRRMFALALLSLPLGIVMMLIALGSNIPRYFVEHQLGEASLGVFGALAYLGVVGKTAIGALGQSATPRLAQYYASGRTQAYRGLLLKLAGFGGVIGAVGVAIAILVGGPVLTMLYQAEYAEHTDVLVWTMVAAAISYVASFTGYGITAARYFRVQIPLFAMVAATAAVACVWLVPDRGLVGAAMSLCIAAAAQLLGGVLIVVHAVRAQARTHLE